MYAIRSYYEFNYLYIMSITQLIKKPFVFFAITMAYSFAFPGITKAANPISKLYLNELNENYKPNRSQPDSSYQKASELFILYSSQKDTTLATICLLELSDIERYQGKYEEAFEYLWKAAELFEAKLKDRITSYNVCYTKLLRSISLQAVHTSRYRIRKKIRNNFV